MKRFISFSGGVESTTMCILYGKGATAIWCDTGWEHEAMYERMDTVEQRLKELHDGDFELLRVKPTAKAKGVQVDTLSAYILHSQFMPTKQMRYCTRMFKIEPIERLLKEAGECELMIGFNADEESRTGNLEKLPNVQYSYPLIEAGYTREMCEDILNIHGLHPDFPIYMQRGGCVGCIFKSIAEYKAMYLFSRHEFEQVRQLEEWVQDARKGFFAISMTQRPMSDIAAEVEREKALWGDERVKSMYHKIKASQSCGAFCHR